MNYWATLHRVYSWLQRDRQRERNGMDQTTAADFIPSLRQLFAFLKTIHPFPAETPVPLQRGKRSRTETEGEREKRRWWDSEIYCFCWMDVLKYMYACIVPWKRNWILFLKWGQYNLRWTRTHDTSHRVIMCLTKTKAKWRSHVWQTLTASAGPERVSVSQTLIIKCLWLIDQLQVW